MEKIMEQFMHFIEKMYGGVKSCVPVCKYANTPAKNMPKYAIYAIYANHGTKMQNMHRRVRLSQGGLC